MPSKLASLESQFRASCDAFVDEQKQQLEARLKLDKFGVLKQLCEELGYACMSNAQHAMLAERTRTAEAAIDEQVKTKVQEKLAQLQAQLDHELEKCRLTHAVEVARLQAEIKHIQPKPEPEPELVGPEPEAAANHE